MQKKINKEELADGKSVMDTLKEMLSDVRSQISSSPFVNLLNVDDLVRNVWSQFSNY